MPPSGGWSVGDECLPAPVRLFSPGRLGTGPEAGPSDRYSSETAGLRLCEILPRLAAIRKHPGPVSHVSRQRFPAPILFIVVSRAWIGPAMPRSVLDHRRAPLFCGHGTWSGFRSESVARDVHLRERSRAERTGILIYGAGAARLPNWFVRSAPIGPHAVRSQGLSRRRSAEAEYAPLSWAYRFSGRAARHRPWCNS